MTAGPEEEIALLMRRWEQVKAGDGAVLLIGGEPGNREIAPRAAAHRVAEALVAISQMCAQMYAMVKATVMMAKQTMANSNAATPVLSRSRQ